MAFTTVFNPGRSRRMPLIKTLMVLVVVLYAPIMAHAFTPGKDTSYIGEYPQRIMITGLVQTNWLYLQHKDVQYAPGVPLNIGIGFAIKNTVINFSGSYGIVPLASKEKLRSKIIDFRVHRYSRQFILDILFQRYQGFDLKGPERSPQTFGDLAVMQIGAEGTYMFNGKKFSAKAAFEQSEIQRRSAGSPLLTAGIVYAKLVNGISAFKDAPTNVENMQISLSGGYAYSWVLDDHWLASGMATAGLGLGNELSQLRNARMKVYPTVMARGALGYHRSDWGAYFSFYINQKPFYLEAANDVSLATLRMQFSYVKHF